MKICLLGYNLSKSRKEGVRNLIYGLAKELQKQGVDVFIVTSGESNREITVEGIRVIEISSGKSVYKFIFRVFDFSREAKRVILKEKPDIVHDHFVLPGSSFLITIPIMKSIDLKGISYVKTIYNRSLDLTSILTLTKNFNLKYFIYEGLIRIIFNNTLFDNLIYRKFDYLIYHSDKIGQQLAESRIKHSKINMAINPAYLKKITKNNLKKDLMVSYLGHPSFKKGVSLFLKSSKKVLLDNPKVKVSLALSRTAEGEFTYKEKVKQLQKGFPGRVLLLGEVDPKDVYESSSLMVFPLLNDWSAIAPPLSLLEALATGAIVLVSKVCGMEEIIKDGFNGYTFDKLDSGLLARLIESSLKACNKNKMRIEAKKTASLHQWGDIVKDYLKVYKALINTI